MGSEAAAMAELITALEKATLMAKQLPNAREPSHIRQIYATFHSTHHRLTMFLQNQLTPFPQPSLLQPPATPQNDSMRIGDDENEAQQILEERNKEFLLRNRRPKRQLSPSYAAEQERVVEDEAVRRGDMVEFESPKPTLTSLDLVYQCRG